MNESNNKKIIAYGIIILFLGTAIVPSISGNTAKIGIQSSKGPPIGSPLDDEDYVNAYWKFNECNGNTLGDSAHDYDGVISGATWTTNGYSGCGLVFDGVNDYVDLEPHAKELGINKTDDLIITFYFKSDSDGGVIFSSTGVKNIPELRIELCANGSISFKMWTTMCGLLLFSGGTYNNGVWHQGEIIFNGLSTDPTISIYIDNDFKTSLTDWLCPIDGSDFINARIGSRASDGTDVFDGVLDEFKMVKYENGNKQKPPTIDGTEIGKPDIEYDYTFQNVDPEGDDIYIDINWDDGTITEDVFCESGGQVIVSHTWDEDGRYEVKAKSEDFWHFSQWSDPPFVVKIGNQAPDQPIITGQRYGDSGQQLTYTFVSEDFEEEDIKYEIDWDDGTTTETGFYASGQEVTETNSWDTNDDYFIKVRGEDTGGKIGEWSVYHIRIGDRPPNNPNIFGSVQGIPNIDYQFAFSAIDPEGDNITYDIDWGDGNQELNIGPFSSGKTLSLSHRWTDSDTYLVKAQATDEFGYPSGWSAHQIIIPRNKAYSLNILEQLFERFPNAFLIFRHLLRL